MWVCGWGIVLCECGVWNVAYFCLIVVIFFFFQAKAAYEIGVRLLGSEMCKRESPEALFYVFHDSTGYSTYGNFSRGGRNNSVVILHNKTVEDLLHAQIPGIRVTDWSITVQLTNNDLSIGITSGPLSPSDAATE